MSMMKCLRSLSLFLILFPIFSFAADDIEPQTTYFKVEVIIFEPLQANEDSPSVQNPFFSNLDKAILLEPNIAQQDFSLLDKTAYRLNWQEKRLKNQNRVLLHLAWLQSEGNKKPVFIDSQLFNADDKRIDKVKGLIQIEKDRFFSLSTQLMLERPCDVQNSERCFYPMNEKRNLKANKLYYFDSPLYGFLLKITPESKIS